MLFCTNYLATYNSSIWVHVELHIVISFCVFYLEKMTRARPKRHPWKDLFPLRNESALDLPPVDMSDPLTRASFAEGDLSPVFNNASTEASGASFPLRKYELNAGFQVIATLMITIEMRCIDIEARYYSRCTELDYTPARVLGNAFTSTVDANLPVICWIVPTRLPPAIQSTIWTELAF